MKNYLYRARLSTLVFRMMKYSLIVMLLIALGTPLLLAEPSQGQALKDTRMDLTIQNGSLKDALTQIKQKTKFKLIYNESLISTYKVSVTVKNERLDLLLRDLLKDTKLDFRESDGKVILFEKPPVPVKKSPAETSSSLTPVLNLSKEIDRQITGTIIDRQNEEALPGVSVLVKGTNIGAITDVEGHYVLRVPDSGPVVLVFSFIGYKKHEIEVGNSKIVDVALDTELNQLNELVVTGYTTQNRAEFTGSTSHISGDAIASRPVTSFDQALAGQATGVSIISGGGALNEAPVFRIRGFNSIQLSSYPLIIIDGITSFTGDVGNSAENNPLSDLNPNDIESMEILKDASATAIYGSRAANGVVVITTKRGKKGKAKVNYDGWVGLNTKPILPELLGAEDYVMIKNEARINTGLAPAFNLQQTADGGFVDTRWYDYIYKTGTSHNHNLNISGATEATSYFASLGYSNQEGFMIKNTFERTNVRLNLDHKVTKKLSFGTNITYSNSENSNLTSGTGAAFSLNNLARMGMVLPPNLSPFNEDGTYNIVGNSIGYGANSILTGYYNMLPLIEHDKFTSESNSFMGSAYGELEILKGLTLRTNYSVNILNTENKSFNNPYQAGGFSTNGSANNSMNKNKRIGWTNTLNYTTTIATDHSLSILAGTEVIQTSSNDWGVTRQNLNDRFFDTFEGGWATLRTSSGSFAEDAFQSYFSSVNYDFKKKYLLSASFRRDGFSGLAMGHKYGNFGGASLGWNISEEDFFKNSTLSTFITGLKLRGSYGQVGNVNIGEYSSLSLYESATYGGLATTLSPSQTGNTDLRWETSKKTDFGVNISLFNNRVTIDADYYKNNIDGMILDAVQAPSKGIPGNTITYNVGSMYNSGFEFDLNTTLINNKDFRWSVNFNVSTLKNEVTELANNNTDIWSSGLETSNITRVGHSIGAIYVVETTGVNPANGLRKYLNRNGEEVQYNPVGSSWTYLDDGPAPALDAFGDGYVAGNSIPSYYGGFNNTISFKNFDLTANFVYSGGNKMYNGTRATLLDNRFFNNQTDILRRWTTPGQITDIPKLHYNDQYASGSVLMHSANVENGGYVKLKNISLGYRVPVKILHKVGISSMRIYTSATNFLIHTKYTGSDPEISANGNSNTQAGRDKNAVPAGKSFTLGLNIGF
ncbi:TonB-linked SusC/RagA family outer membrane protein [Dyadobacter jejuensis]|uniref:TonB-linked SusC/RagA family outer membrane protein n=1 Tax=Dyadobacter jejuensis TaxID=1082580 RepID=A0A316AG19_9BACT|nr:TonB-dependent receptor [Dyadobacter jejuensis]PWJ55910.1 TonB-linked SusC/RagA family outer membrane protein [Dyadobacter jejuensis]